MLDHGKTRLTALTLLFAPGQRPDAQAIARMAGLPAENTAFMISFDPGPDEGWLELLSMGLGFDITGLAPASPALASPPEHFYGIDRTVVDARPEAVRLVPGPHLAGGQGMLPILRVLAGLGAELARLPGLRAIGWEPARSWMAPAYFMSAIRAWLMGGTFPALGLAGLSRRADGALESEGLSLFTGFEVRIDPFVGEPPQEAAKLAARIMHELVSSGDVSLGHLADRAGRSLHASFGQDKGLLRIWREG